LSILSPPRLYYGLIENLTVDNSDSDAVCNKVIMAMRCDTVSKWLIWRAFQRVIYKKARRVKDKNVYGMYIANYSMRPLVWEMLHILILNGGWTLDRR
jgi:protein-disulfide isomerase-like protein with CxxC motif